jgi:hypothetical protein
VRVVSTHSSTLTTNAQGQGIREEPLPSAATGSGPRQGQGFSKVKLDDFETADAHWQNALVARISMLNFIADHISLLLALLFPGFVWPIHDVYSLSHSIWPVLLVSTWFCLPDMIFATTYSRSTRAWLTILLFLLVVTTITILLWPANPIVGSASSAPIALSHVLLAHHPTRTTKLAGKDLRRALRRTAARLHPDKVGSPDAFLAFRQAYDVLGDTRQYWILRTFGPALLSIDGIDAVDADSLLGLCVLTRSACYLSLLALHVGAQIFRSERDLQKRLPFKVRA